MRFIAKKKKYFYYGLELNMGLLIFSNLEENIILIFHE